MYASIEAHEASTAGDDGEDERLQEAYREVLYRDFTFVRTKSRTYEQMLRSSSHPRGFEKVLAIYHELFEGYLIDYSNFTFDIYEDSPSGLNIVIPEGTELTVANGKHLLVKGSMFCRRCPYEIQYFVRRLPTDSAQLINQSPSVFLNAMADEHWQELNQEGSYSEYSDIRDIEEYGDNRYVLRAAFSDFDAPFQNRYEVNYYTAAVNQETWFQVEGILNRFDDKFLKQLRVQGSDCRVDDLSKKETRICNDVKVMMKILISVHLTSFSNKFMQSNHTT